MLLQRQSGQFITLLLKVVHYRVLLHFLSNNLQI